MVKLLDFEGLVCLFFECKGCLCLCLCLSLNCGFGILDLSR